MFKTFFLRLIFKKILTQLLGILYVKLWVLEAGGFPRLENIY
jgi:hypothetical protein